MIIIYPTPSGIFPNRFFLEKNGPIREAPWHRSTLGPKASTQELQQGHAHTFHESPGGQEMTDVLCLFGTEVLEGSHI